MICINLATLIVVSVLCFCYVMPGFYELYQIFYPIVLLFIFSMLLYAGLGIHRTIKQVARAFPNEKLICVHFINFVLWLTLIIAETVLGTISDFMDNRIDSLTDQQKLTHVKILYSSLIFTNIQIPFVFWLSLWLLYLILKSTASRAVESYGVRDLVLGHKVPPIVFVKNQKLLKQIVASEIESDPVLRQKIRMQARYNELVHAMVTTTQSSVALDEKLGVTYLNLDKAY